MDKVIQKNLHMVIFDVKCDPKDAYMYLDYNGQINRDCLGNIKPFLPRIVIKDDRAKFIVNDLRL
jgi:hypothetical protein